MNSKTIEKKQYHYLYKITNKINNKYYYGIHSTTNLDDGYMGSGAVLKQAIKKYGSENFTKEIITFCNTREELIQCEKDIITEQMVNDKNCYNIHLGGEGFTKGYVYVKTPDNQHVYVSKTHEKYVSGEYKPLVCAINLQTQKREYVASSLVDNIHYKHISSGKTLYKDEYGNVYRLSIDDPLIIQLNLKQISTHMAVMRDKEGKVCRLDKTIVNDMSGYVGNTKGYANMKNKYTGEEVFISMDSEEYKSGKYVGRTKGMICARDKFGNTLQVSLDDERLKTKEVVPIATGFINVRDEYGKILHISKDSEEYLKYKDNHMCRGMKLAYNKNTNKWMLLHPLDERIVSGEWEFKKRIRVKTLDGEIILLPDDDERIAKGQVIMQVFAKSKSDKNYHVVFADDERIKTGEMYLRGTFKRKNI